MKQMTKLFALSALAACAAGPALATAMQDVVLFEEGALVTDALNVNARQGAVAVRLPGAVRQGSIQVAAAGFQVDSLTLCAVPAAQNPALRAARAELAARQREAAALSARLRLCQSPRPNVGSVEELRKLDAYLAEQSSALSAKVGEAQSRAEEAALRVKQLEAQAKERGESGSEVELAAVIRDAAGKPVSGPVALHLSYQLEGCGWSRTMDVSASTQQGRVTVAERAQIRQASGVDWEAARLRLSSGTLGAVSGPRALSPWRIEPAGAHPVSGQRADLAYAMNEERSVAPGASRAAKAAPRRVEGAQAQVWSLGSIAIPAGKATSLLLASQDWKADFYRLARPRTSSAAFLIAHVALDSSAQILPGQARFRVDGQETGHGQFSFRGKEAEISFGRDPLVTATMQSTVSRSNEEGFIVNKKQTYEWDWVIELANAHSSPVDVRIEDALPQAGDKRIEIRMTDEPKPETVGKALVWKMHAAPGKTKIRHAVQMQAPTDLDLRRGR